MEKLINSSLCEIIASINIDKRLKEAVLYAVNSGGKRVRPKIACYVYKARRGNLTGEILRMASALEMIHTASLIHDDLPGIDNDDFRRHKPTLHKKFDEATAILAGDLLFMKGLGILSENKTLGEKAIDTVELLINGEFLDIEFERKLVEFNDWMAMIKGKTGALIRLSFETGAILGEYSNSERDKLANAGELIGIAFQMTDDLLDIEGSEEVVGKKLKKDSIEGKCTALAYFSPDDLKVKINDFFTRGLATINSIEGDFYEMIKFLNFLKEREK